MKLRTDIIKVRNEDGQFTPLQNVIIGEQDLVPMDKVIGLPKVAQTGKYSDLIGAPDPDDLIIDAGIEVGTQKPERTSIDVWIDTNKIEKYRIPEIKDEVINNQDTWSSEKIDNFVRTAGAGIYMHAEKPEDENINLWLDTELTEEDGIIRVPEINDNEISTEDTWSSDKIRKEIDLSASGLTEFSTLVNLIYPIGSIYTSTQPTHPSTLFGGDWVQIKGRFLLTADDETYIAGNEGGEAEHTLSIDEMPSHSHRQYVSANNGSQAIRRDYSSDANSALFDQGCSTGETGGNLPHNNMPPYLVVYAWRRIA